MEKEKSEEPNHFEVDGVIDGSRIRVHTDDHSYEGWGRTREDKSVLLYDAERDDEEWFDTVVVHDPNIIERFDEIHTVELLRPETLQSSPYNVREIDLGEVDPSRVPPKRHKKIYEHQKLFSYPVANHTTNEEYVLIAGHRRVAAAEYADIERIPVRVVDVSEWRATQMFVHEHFPYPTESAEETPELYTAEEVTQSLELLREDWSDYKLESLFPLREILDDPTTISSS